MLALPFSIQFYFLYFLHSCQVLSEYQWIVRVAWLVFQLFYLQDHVWWSHSPWLWEWWWPGVGTPWPVNLLSLPLVREAPGRSSSSSSTTQSLVTKFWSMSWKLNTEQAIRLPWTPYLIMALNPRRWASVGWGLWENECSVTGINQNEMPCGRSLKSSTSSST